MGELIEFPKGEPEGEGLRVGYCCHCGAANGIPLSAAWPNACVNGCTPLAVSSVPPHPNTVGRITFGRITFG